MITRVGEYQGKKTLSIMKDQDDRWPTTMGARKLAAVVSMIPDVLKFLLEHGGDEGKDAVTEFTKHYTPVNSKSKKAKE